MSSVVLINPEIPQNTGNIARLTAAMGVELHLIEPLGFKLTDRYLRRAGLDYWPETRLTVHGSWDEFLEHTQAPEDHLWLFSARGGIPYYNVRFLPDDYLLFGSETSGLPSALLNQYARRRVLIPMRNPRVRSINLSSSVAAGLCEALRQLEWTASDPG